MFCLDRWGYIVLLCWSRIFDAPSTRTQVVKQNYQMWTARIGIVICGGLLVFLSALWSDLRLGLYVGAGM